MNFHSLTTPSLRRSFSAAVIEGLAPDRGLYFPDSIPQLDEASWLEDPHGECWSIASKIIHSFSSEDLEMSELQELMKDVLNFPIELIELEGGL
jgi:threonine synthase